jgi:hypothetical protein
MSNAKEKLLKDGVLKIPASYAKLITSGEMTRVMENRRLDLKNSVDKFLNELTDEMIMKYKE